MLVLVIGPLEKWRPVEPVTDKQAVRVDILYTLIHRLGLFRVALFFSVEPLFDDLFGMLRVHGVGTFQLDQVWAGATDIAWVSFAIYLIVFDFADYWIHRGQHQFEWWWALHSLQHSQQQMTMWSDNLNHLLDDLIRDSLLVVLGQLIGVGPGQFVAIVAVTQLSESLQHANLRLWFGRVGERSPGSFVCSSRSKGLARQEGWSDRMMTTQARPGNHRPGRRLTWMTIATAELVIPDRVEEFTRVEK